MKTYEIDQNFICTEHASLIGPGIMIFATPSENYSRYYLHAAVDRDHARVATLDLGVIRSPRDTDARELKAEAQKHGIGVIGF